MYRHSAPCDLADLEHARCLHNGRLPLPFGKFGRFCAVRINTGKSLAVFIKDRNLPVSMLAPFVLAELGAFSFFQGLYPTQTISIARGPRKYRFEQYSSSKGKATNERVYKAERTAPCQTILTECRSNRFCRWKPSIKWNSSFQRTHI